MRFRFATTPTAPHRLLEQCRGGSPGESQCSPLSQLGTARAKTLRERRYTNGHRAHVETPSPEGWAKHTHLGSLVSRDDDHRSPRAVRSARRRTAASRPRRSEDDAPLRSSAAQNHPKHRRTHHRVTWIVKRLARRVVTSHTREITTSQARTRWQLSAFRHNSVTFLG